MQNFKNLRIVEPMIGDTLFMEPALRALATAQDAPVVVSLQGPARAVLEQNPHVVMSPPDQCDETCDETTEFWFPVKARFAFNSSTKRRRHICEGFFMRFGLNPEGMDCKPRLYGDNLQPACRPPKGARSGRIAIAPFSASCLVHATGKANKTIDLDWWNELIPKLPLPVDSFGREGEPHLSGCSNHRGLPLRSVAKRLQQCEALIGGDTGLTIIAGALDADILLLSCTDAAPVWLTGPQTRGRFEVVYSPAPPAWTHDQVLQSLARILAD